MRPLTRRSAGTLVGAALLAGPTAAALAAPVLERLEIIAPAATGSGWSQTAQAMKAALEGEGLVGRVEIQQVPGAGGTVGLARFVKDRHGPGDAVLLTGLIMLGAELASRPAATLADTTPLARLAGDYEVVVVPTSSPLRSLADLMTALRADTRAVAWAGGSLGGTDHILAALLTRQAGGDPARMRYAPYAGGGESLPAVLSGAAAVGVNSHEEFAAEIAAGRLRALAISAPQPVPAIGIPTFKEQGVPVELVDWRGVVGAPGLDPAKAQALGGLLARMVQTATWQRLLQERHWLDLYQPAEAFAAFLVEERRDLRQLLTETALVQ
ncbi:MAG: tripartite tricarboxylate transporter substrate binding protein [Geminicoccaceae bacterium]